MKTKVIIYSNPFIAPEWIEAHGLIPYRLIPAEIDEKGPLCCTEGMCPYMCTFMNDAVRYSDAAGIVITTTCDQMRRGFDLIKKCTDIPLFLMNIPSTWQTPHSFNLYRTELHRLSRFLIHHGAHSPDWAHLYNIMIKYESLRLNLSALQGMVSAADYITHLSSFYEKGRIMEIQHKHKPEKMAIPIALIGGSLSKPELEFFTIIEKYGGRIVLDGTETGERTFPSLFNRRLIRENPFDVLTEAYFGAIPDVARRPNSQFFKWLKREIAERSVKGVILIRYVWCDLWHAEVQRLRDWLPVPMIDIDMNGKNPSNRNITRIQAFMESLV